MLLVLLPALLVTLLALAMLTADWGQVQLVRAELQGAADAAALAGAVGLSDGTAYARAIDAAGDNYISGKLGADTSDVTVGRWDVDTGQFTAGGTPNAVRVALHASIPTLFAHLLGIPEVQLSASAVSVQPAAPAISGLVALDSFRLNSHATVKSFDSNAGFWSSGNSGSDAVGASNGTIEINSNATFAGELHHLPGKPVTVSGNATIGGVSELEEPLSFPLPSLPGTYVHRGSHTQSSGALVLDAGVYRYDELVINAGAKLTVTGPVTLYVTEKFELHAHSSGDSHLPSQLRIVALSGAEVIVNSHSSLSAEIYAPGSDVVVNSHTTFAGSIVSQNLLINSHADVFVDTAGAGQTPGGAPRLVK